MLTKLYWSGLIADSHNSAGAVTALHPGTTLTPRSRVGSSIGCRMVSFLRYLELRQQLVAQFDGKHVQDVFPLHPPRICAGVDTDVPFIGWLPFVSCVLEAHLLYLVGRHALRTMEEVRRRLRRPTRKRRVHPRWTVPRRSSVEGFRWLSTAGSVVAARISA